MKRLSSKLKKVLQDYGEDIQYLLITGLPIGLFLILLSHCFNLGEVY